MRRRIFLLSAFAAAVAGTLVYSAPAALSQDAAKMAKGADPEDVSFESADGVKLNARFWKAVGGRGPCVLLMPSFLADPTKGDWDALGSMLSGAGYNALRLEYRGHGKSTDINPKMFWQENQYISPINKALVKGGDRTPPKNDLFIKDFRPNYFPVLVNDVMAARSFLERKNDSGEVNASSMYLIGATDAATLGFLYMTAEWKREAKQANLAVPIQFVSGNRTARAFIPPNADAVGKDIAGAVWLSPTRHPSIPEEAIKNWVSTLAPDIRTETPMLFLAGKDDEKGVAGAAMYFDRVLVAKRKSSTVKPLEQTFSKTIAKTKLAGVGLLGNNDKFATETQILDFLKAVEKERKGKAPFNRDYTKPLPIALNTFGVNIGQ